MAEIKFSPRLRIQITENQILSIRKFQHQYQAAVLDMSALTCCRSNLYQNPKLLNRFTEKYGVKLTF